MLNDTTLGLISMGVPLLIVGFLLLRRLPWVFAFFVALLVVGLGYLETTGAVRDIGHQVRDTLPEGVLAEQHATPDAQPAAETTPAPAPAEPAVTPPVETAPATPPAETTPAPEPEHTAPSDSTMTPPASEPSSPPPATTP